MRSLVLVALLACAACSTESKVTPVVAATSPLPAAKNWALSVHGCGKPADCDEIRREVLGALLNAYLVEGLVPPGQPAPATLDVDVTRLRTVSMGERIAFGVMAGRNAVSADVVLKDQFGATLRSFRVESASAAHPFSGQASAQDAYRQLGTDIVSALR